MTGALARPRDLLAGLRDPAAVRLRCAAVTQAVSDGRSGHFRVDRRPLAALAERVGAALRERYAEGRVPAFSLWRDVEAGGVSRAGELDALLAGRSAAEQARARFDLVVVSVLLGAEAGAPWRYREGSGAVDALALPPQRHGRDQLLGMLDAAAAPAGAPSVPAAEPAEASGAGLAGAEGLAVASLRAFMAGAFSSSADDPLRADATALKLVDPAALRALFQARSSNPLVGIEGRAGLLQRLGDALLTEAAREGQPARPGLLFDRVTEGGSRSEVSATALLQMLLRALGPVWRGGGMVKGVPAGDAWPHAFAGAGGADPATAGWVPFHQFGQWMVWSLVEPLQQAGVTVTHLAALTGLPGSACGGLLQDAGVINPRRERDLARRWATASEFVIEWRALTVTLLDELALQSGLPLASVLMGCRLLAGAAPPLHIDSDGTVF